MTPWRCRIAGPARNIRASMGSPQLFTRGAALLALLAVTVSCALFQPEESLSPTPTITAAVPTSVPPIPSTTTTNPEETSTTLPPEPTVTADPGTTTTTSITGVLLEYLDQLLTTEAGFADLGTNLGAINDNWDKRSQTRVTFEETEDALEITVERARGLEEAFVLIPAPSESGLWEEHRIASSAVGIMSDAPQEMLDGLRSPDVGHARRTAFVGFLTAFDLFKQVAERVTVIIGEDGIALLETRRSQNTGSATTLPGPTTTQGEPTTTAAPTTTQAPPNPGNSKNCRDFSTQAEAQEWYDAYFPFYGDVAKLDTNNNQVACESLP